MNLSKEALGPTGKMMAAGGTLLLTELITTACTPQQEQMLTASLLKTSLDSAASQLTYENVGATLTDTACLKTSSGDAALAGKSVSAAGTSMGFCEGNLSLTLDGKQQSFDHAGIISLHTTSGDRFLMTVPGKDGEGARWFEIKNHQLQPTETHASVIIPQSGEPTVQLTDGGKVMDFRFGDKTFSSTADAKAVTADIAQGLGLTAETPAIDYSGAMEAWRAGGIRDQSTGETFTLGETVSMTGEMKGYPAQNNGDLVPVENRFELVSADLLHPDGTKVDGREAIFLIDTGSKTANVTEPQAFLLSGPSTEAGGKPGDVVFDLMTTKGEAVSNLLFAQETIGGQAGMFTFIRMGTQEFLLMETPAGATKPSVEPTPSNLLEQLLIWSSSPAQAAAEATATQTATATAKPTEKPTTPPTPTVPPTETATPKPEFSVPLTTEGKFDFTAVTQWPEFDASNPTAFKRQLHDYLDYVKQQAWYPEKTNAISWWPIDVKQEHYRQITMNYAQEQANHGLHLNYGEYPVPIAGFTFHIDNSAWGDMMGFISPTDNGELLVVLTPRAIVGDVASGKSGQVTPDLMREKFVDWHSYLPLEVFPMNEWGPYKAGDGTLKQIVWDLYQAGLYDPQAAADAADYIVAHNQLPPGGSDVLFVTRTVVEIGQ
jgi:hypothetical protein